MKMRFKLKIEMTMNTSGVSRKFQLRNLVTSETGRDGTRNDSHTTTALVFALRAVEIQFIQSRNNMSKKASR